MIDINGTRQRLIMQSARTFHVPHIGIEGALLTLAPAPFIFACTHGNNSFPPLWRLTTATFTAVSCVLMAFYLFRNPRLGKFWGGVSIAGCVATAFPYLVTTPFAGLLGFVAAFTSALALKDFKVRVNQERQNIQRDHSLQRARWSALTVPLLVVLALILDPEGHTITNGAIAIAAMTNVLLFLHWVWNKKSRVQFCIWSAPGLLAMAGIISAFMADQIRIAAILLSIILFILLPKSRQVSQRTEHWWEPLLNHPARVLFSSFLCLCILGALLLQLPGATQVPSISLIDAAFTSVSAVCVTGLVVLDTAHDFSLFGQILILLLIQLGGLGIMTITTVALHAMGRRLSLHHERILTIITDTNRQDLLTSLITILKFTFIAETLGALILSGLFYRLGDPLWAALWRGVFTSISAFCNAGFALQSNSLIPYQGNPLILHTISLLIIFGGMAPATSLIIPKWLRKRPIPLAANIALITTSILLFSGTFLILIFEWNGALAGLSILDKLHNAWFQSVTLRTAGFNSIELSNSLSPTFLIMLCLMFIGGNPGGTAGGVKTTTIGILAMTFWATITGRTEVIAQNLRIAPRTINRAITIIGSGGLVWLIMVLMLDITQQIPTRDIIFEVTSALGTVGLSTGATAHLDTIGKIILSIAMFVGRIGPITMFMLLSEDQPASHSQCLDAQVTLT